MAQYGFDVTKLGDFARNVAAEHAPYGSRRRIESRKEYGLESIEIKKGGTYSLEVAEGLGATIFVEFGRLRIRNTCLEPHELMSFESQAKESLYGEENTCVYLAFGPLHGYNISTGGAATQKEKPFDYRDKYWGNIQTIVNKSYAAKRIFCRKGEYSSLEYHCVKHESYFVHSGKLLVRLRAGRAQDYYVELSAGSSIFIPPGLMHQRGGIEDTVIIEISTHDEDSDSYLVEDGQRQTMPHLKEFVRDSELPTGEKKRICFDIDGCLCTQTEGDYEAAQPNHKAIKLVNKLYKEGYWIVLYTARFMGRNNNNIKTTYEEGCDFTKNQLASWGVLYHDLVMGKPPADVVVDDRAVFFKDDWGLIEQQIRKKLHA